MRKDKLITLLVFYLLVNIGYAQNISREEYIDSLMVKATNTAFTKSGLKYADELIELGNKYGYDKATNRGLECKACIYVNEDMYDELDMFCDSIDQNSQLQKEAPYVYYYITYTHGKAYMRQAKYNLAINLAKQMYEDGKGMMNRCKRTTNDDEDLAKGVETLVQGIDILAEAYSEIGQYQTSIDYYEESIEACKQLRNDEVSTNWMTSSYGRMCTAMEMYEYVDGNKLLEYVDMFSQDLSKWADQLYRQRISRSADAVL